MCPNDLRSGPIYRFLSGSQLTQMTKIPFEILHFCEITNFGHNSNMAFLVLQVGGLLEGSVQLSAVAHLSYILFFCHRCPSNSPSDFVLQVPSRPLNSFGFYPGRCPSSNPDPAFLRIYFSEAMQFFVCAFPCLLCS